MDAQVFVRKTRTRVVEEKLKEITFTLLIKTLLLIENICSQICGKNSFKRIRKIGSKLS